MKFKIIPLEERIVLDAAGTADIIDSYHFEHQQADTFNSDTSDHTFTPVADHTGDQAPATRVLVISSNIKDPSILSQSVLSNVRVVMYDPQTTSLQQLSDKISASLNGQKADSIAFVNEGGAGNFQLTDNIILSADSLNGSADLQAFWRHVGELTKDNGRIDLLACDVAGTSQGDSLLKHLDSLLDEGAHNNVNLAASTDATGNSQAGGDWLLEVGGVDVKSIYFDSQKIDQWTGLLNLNNAPIGTDKSITVLENHSYTFTTADFGFSDPNDSPANNLLAVKISTLPINGSLKLDGIPINANELILASDIAASKLVFTPDANANGTAYSNFTFQVQDDGGTLNEGVDTDQSPNTITFDVTSNNSAPTGTSNTININYLSKHVFLGSEFGFSDSNDSPANNFLAVKITSLPSLGFFMTYDSFGRQVNVTPGQVIPLSTINSQSQSGFYGLTLGIIGDPETTQLNYTSFTFQVQDNGGTDNGGVDFDPTPKTMTINSIARINEHAPSGANKSIATNEDTSYTFSKDDFGFSDSGDSPPNYFLEAKITSNIVGGTLNINGVTATIGSTIHAYDLENNTVIFTPSPDLNKINSTLLPPKFSFQVKDDGFSPNVGTVNTISFRVDSVNDAPMGESHTVTLNENTSYIFKTEDFPLSDPHDAINDTPGNNLLNVIITSLPTSGTLTSNGIAVAAGQSISVATINANGLVYTPTEITSGDPFPYFTFQVQDNGNTLNGGVDIDPIPHTMTLEIMAANNPPSAENNTLNVNENSFAISQLTATDQDNDTLSYTLVDSGQAPLIAAADGSYRTDHGTITYFNSNTGSYTYTPDPYYYGSDLIYFIANDGIENSNVGTIEVTINFVNTPPTARDDSVFGTQDRSVDFNPLQNDTDPDRDILTIDSYTNPLHGTLDLINNMFSYTPNDGYGGQDSFDYTIKDGNGGYSTAHVSITINYAPVIQNPNTPLIVDENGNSSENLITFANIIDLDGDNLFFTLNSSKGSNAGPDHGTLDLHLDGTFTYTPEANYFGPDRFSYRVIDGKGGLAIGELQITVISSLPMAVPDTYTVNEDGSLSGNVLDNDLNLNGHTLTLALNKGGTSNGNLTFNPDGTFTYLPNGDYYGEDRFTYKMTDESGNITTALVTITVNPVNDAPIAQNDSYNNISANTVFDSSTLRNGSIIGNDTDVEQDNLSASLVTGATHGQVTLYTDGTFIYVPDQNFSGTDSFTYKASDGQAYSNIATVTLDVTGGNTAPVAQNGNNTTNEDTAVPGQLIANDPDSTSLTYSLVADPSHGTVTVNPDGTYTYTPNDNYYGSDSFTYKASDGLLDSNIATINITVNPVNDAPVASGASTSTNEDTALNGSLSATDVDSASLTYSRVTNAAHGTVTVNANGTYIYTPNANYYGSDSFTYKASDGSLDSNTATVNLTVNPVNDAPVASNQAISLNANSSISGAVSAIDIDSSTLTYSISTAAQHGTVTLNSNGTFTYTPNTNYSGTDSFTYKANDGSLNSNIATVNITVNPVNTNRAPVAYNDSYNTGATSNLIVNVMNGVLANDKDPDAGTKLTAQLITGPQHGTLSLNKDGSFSYTAKSGYTGPDSFTYKASDGKALSNLAAVSIVVNAKPQIQLDGSSHSSYVENAAPTRISPLAVSVSDADATNFGGAKLTVNISKNGTSPDVLSIVSESGKVLVSGNSIYNGSGVLIGTYTGGTNMTSLVATFNSNATAANVLEVVRHIGFSVNSDIPSTNARTISFKITDAYGAQSRTENKIVDVYAVNDAATINAIDTTIGVHKNTITNIGQNSEAGLSISDIDGTSNSLYVIKLNISQGNLGFTSTSGINKMTFSSVTSNSITLVGTRNQINQALSQLTYKGTTIGTYSLDISLIDTGLNTGSSFTEILPYIGSNLSLDKKTIFITVTT